MMPQRTYAHALPSLRALVTGAASGVGLACARELARRDVELILADNDGRALWSLGSALGADVFICDVTCEKSVTRLLATARSRFQGLDLILNAAGPAYVRSLGMMRIGRLFISGSLDEFERRTLIVNIVAEPQPNHSLFVHAGSKPAFIRMSEALGRQANGSGPRFMTVDGLNGDAMIADFIEQVCREAACARENTYACNLQ